MKFQTVTITEQDNDIRLDRFFKRHFPDVPFGMVAKAVRRKAIRLNGARCDVSTRLCTGDVISFPSFNVDENPTEVKKDFSKQAREFEKYIIYKDSYILVINKPAGLAVQGGTGINVSVDDLATHWNFEYEDKPKLVHRIDKETSGILILARKVDVAAELSELFKRRQIDKFYTAITKGVIDPRTGTLVSYLAKKQVDDDYEKVVSTTDGKKAITNYEVIDYAASSYALLSLNILTGRTHQIRQQLAEKNCPILGDSKYGNRESTPNFIKPKLYLHATLLKFELRGKLYELKADFPDYFKDALLNLGLDDRK